MTRETMGDIEHTNPHTGRAFGENGGVFTRGPAVADGGADEEMRDVEHEAPDGDGANDVWERGVETSTNGADATAPAADTEDTEDDVDGTDERMSGGRVPATEDAVDE